MNQEHGRYVRKETLIAVGINSALSALFALIVFGGKDAAPVRDVAFDAFPQSFMIALMTTLVPTALTRRRLRQGAVPPLATGAMPLPRNLLLRALLVAVTGALVGGGLNWLLLPLLAPELWLFGPLLAFKILYGGLLALLLAPAILRRALADGLEG